MRDLAPLIGEAHLLLFFGRQVSAVGVVHLLQILHIEPFGWNDNALTVLSEVDCEPERHIDFISCLKRTNCALWS